MPFFSLGHWREHSIFFLFFNQKWLPEDSFHRSGFHICPLFHPISVERPVLFKLFEFLPCVLLSLFEEFSLLSNLFLSLLFGCFYSFFFWNTFLVTKFLSSFVFQFKKLNSLSISLFQLLPSQNHGFLILFLFSFLFLLCFLDFFETQIFFHLFLLLTLLLHHFLFSLGLQLSSFELLISFSLLFSLCFLSRLSYFIIFLFFQFLLSLLSF